MDSSRRFCRSWFIGSGLPVWRRLASLEAQHVRAIQWNRRLEDSVSLIQPQFSLPQTLDGTVAGRTQADANLRQRAARGIDHEHRGTLGALNEPGAYQGMIGGTSWRSHLFQEGTEKLANRVLHAGDHIVRQAE